MESETSAATEPRERGTMALLCALGGAIVLVHALVGNRYGFHRDELATLSDARRLAWGYVAYPPVTPFFGWLSLHLFGTSLAGFRFFASLAGALAVVLTGAMARDLGGSRGAQFFAALAAAAFALACGTLMQYVSFDYLAWVMVAFSVARLCRTNDPRWWLAVGVAIAFGMLSKYSMLFLVAGLGVGCLLDRELRAHLGTRWPWLGAALALTIFLPNLIWEWRHDFVSLQFLQTIHARDVRIGRAKDFLPGQLQLTLCALPVAICGLVFYFWRAEGRRFRVLGWMFVVPFALFVLGKGRAYYMAPGYPMLYAGGAVLLSTWITRLGPIWCRVVAGLGWLGLAANTLIIGAVSLPIAPVNSHWWNRVVQMNGDLKEEIGWPELAAEVSRICAALPAADRARVRVLAGNYGEAGALELYGPALGLPPIICPVNSFWARGYGDPPPEVMIVLGATRADLEGHFESCELVGHITNSAGVANEETSDHPEIYLCRKFRGDWRTAWPKLRRFG